METCHYTNQPPQQSALEKKSFHAQEITRLEAKKMLQAMLGDNFSSWGTFESLVEMHKQLGSDLLCDPELVSLTQLLVEQLHEVGMVRTKNGLNSSKRLLHSIVHQQDKPRRLTPSLSHRRTE